MALCCEVTSGFNVAFAAACEACRYSFGSYNRVRVGVRSSFVGSGFSGSAWVLGSGQVVRLFRQFRHDTDPNNNLQPTLDIVFIPDICTVQYYDYNISKLYSMRTIWRVSTGVRQHFVLGVIYIPDVSLQHFVLGNITVSVVPISSYWQTSILILNILISLSWLSPLCIHVH